MKLVVTVLTVNLAIASAAAAQPTASPSATSSSTQDVSTADPPRPPKEDDAVLNPAEPDVVVVNLPTGMRLPLFKSNFRLTHRFAGNLRRGSFGHQLSNLFGLDQGAIIGFEYRVAVAPNAQAAFYRSSFDKTIQFHGAYNAMRQRGSIPLSLSALASIEGTNNFQEKYAPAVGAVVSRTFSTRVAGYVTPVWVDNTAASLDSIADDYGGEEHAADASLSVRRHTTFVGVGARVRVAGTTYLAGEIAPRVAGYAPDEPAYGVSLEKRVGGHMFSLTFTNSFGTTFAQVARGGAANALYFGFNLGRKFY